MPASKKQTKANKQNAKKSTGPKTDEGKATASRNSTTYGLYSNKLVIDSKYHKENRVDYELLVESLRWELDPQSCFQEYLVRKIANALWRTQRAALAETAQINKQLNNLDDAMYCAQRSQASKSQWLGIENEPLDFSSDETQDYSDMVMKHAIPDKDFAFRILHYEMRLDRQLTRTYNLLRKLQQQNDDRETAKTKNTSHSKNEPNLL